jgi:hypothetical protein
MIHMGQMILSEPSIIIIWTYQDMMEWMSRILDGEMAGADENFGAEIVQMWLNFVPSPNHKSNSSSLAPVRNRIETALERQRHYAAVGTPPSSQDELPSTDDSSSPPDNDPRDGLESDAHTGDQPGEDPSPSPSTAQPSAGHADNGANPAGETARESTQQQQSAGEGDDITGARSAGSQPQTANTDRPQVGTGREAAAGNGGTEPGANVDNGAAGGRGAAN